MYKQCILLNERHPLICLRLRLLYAGFGIIKKIFLQSQKLMYMYIKEISILISVFCVFAEMWFGQGRFKIKQRKLRLKLI